MTKTMTREQVMDSIGSITRRSKRLQDDIHRTAMAILSIWKGTKAEERPEAAQWAAQALTALQNASPYHSNAFSKWVGMYLPLQWADEGKTWYSHKSECHLLSDTFREARDNPFWTVSPPPEAKPFVMMEELDRLIKKAQKHIDQPVEGDEINPEMVRQLQSLREGVKA